MRRTAILALVLLTPACQDRAPGAAETAAPPAPPTVATAPPAPAPSPLAQPAQQTEAPEVARLAERIAQCQHFSGEEPYDAARAAELRRQVEASCPGNQAELARLRGKHAADRKMMQQLKALAQQVP